jgi:FMN phosphatase YigB (HAD superfamily)
MTPPWINDAGVKLVSFDVFDTVIARRCGAPATIFRITGEKLARRGLLDIQPQAYQVMRILAEERTRRNKGNREVTLAGIYSELNSFWSLPPTLLEQFIACELETESENLFAIPGTLELVRSARQSGRRVVFTSDMYLPEDFFRATLTRLGLMQVADGLYVSSRWGVSKADGGLYRVLLEQEKVQPAQVVHVGDSRVVDYEKARQLGVQAVHRDRGALNQYEIRLAEAECRCADGGPGLAGISRLARLELDESGEQQVTARMGASVAGPLLTQYAEWVLRTARNRGIQRLFFLARDGEALLRLSEILAPAIGAGDIKLHYLYGSRQVWYPAALLKMDNSATEFFATTVAFNAGSWQECVELLGFKPDDFVSASLRSQWNDWLPQIEDKRRLFQSLVGDPIFGPRMKSWLGEKAALTIRYLREAGMVGTENCGLVDCGWSGNWTDVLGDMVEAAGGIKPEVYFLGQRKRKNPARCRTFAFLFDHQSGLGLKNVPDFFHVPVEFFLTADHGRTLGFREEAGRLVPILAPADLQGFTNDQWQVFRAALLRFAELYAARGQTVEMPVDLRSTLMEGIGLLWERPSTGEAALMGKHTISLSPSKQGHEPLARPYQLADVLRVAFRFRLPDYPPFWWHEGALVLTGTGNRILMGTLWQALQFARALRSEGFNVLRRRQLLISTAKKLRWAFQVRPDSAGWQLETVAKKNPIQPVTPGLSNKPVLPRLTTP